MSLTDLNVLLPEIILAIMIVVVMMAHLFFSHKQKDIAYILSQLTLVMVFILGWIHYGKGVTHAFEWQVYLSNLSVVLKQFIYLVSFFVFIYAKPYIEDNKMHEGEFYILSLLSILGGAVLVSSYNMITIYIGLELLSLPLYAMVAMRRHSNEGVEAAMKYFILGAVGSAFLLYGMSFIYGVTGSVNLAEIAQYLEQHDKYNQVVTLSMVLFIVTAAFKLGAAPFHQWVPDVYVGSPNAITLYLSSVPKLAAYGLLINLIVYGMAAYSAQWAQIFLVLGVISIFIGNIFALVQRNIKRLLAYSGIAHVGFVFLALSLTNNDGYAAAMYYMVIYVIMSVAGFGMILMLSRKGIEIENIDEFRGMNHRNPWLAFMMMILMFSMAGIPPFAGFTIKLLVLEALVDAHWYGIAIYALAMSVVGAFYYLRIIKAMYFDPASEALSSFTVPRESTTAMTVNCLILLVFGVFPIYLTSMMHSVFAN
jgi:NADH-quinone oxidoreductase subunit N